MHKDILQEKLTDNNSCKGSIREFFFYIKNEERFVRKIDDSGNMFGFKFKTNSRKSCVSHWLSIT